MLEVKNTRQELLKLRKYFFQVQNAKKLLEEKRDTLVRSLLELKREFVAKKKEIFERTKEIIELVDFSSSFNQISIFDYLGSKKRASFDLEISVFFKMGVKSKIFKIKNLQLESVFTDNLFQSFGDAILKFKEVFPKLIELASLEYTLLKLAKAIQKTKRRVNYLKDIVLPEISQKIQYLKQRLSDQERENFVVSLKFKYKKSAKDLLKT